jgi:hypothetical protein
MGTIILMGIGIVFALFVAWLVGSIVWNSVSKDSSDLTFVNIIVCTIIGVFVLMAISAVFKLLFGWDSNADI